MIETNANIIGTDNAQDKGPCKKFILVCEYQGIAFTPLNVQTNISPCREPTDVTTDVC